MWRSRRDRLGRNHFVETFLKVYVYKALLISDWTNAQLVNFCSACGILFDASALHENEFLDYIRKVKKNCSLSCLIARLEQAETSSDVRGH